MKPDFSTAVEIGTSTTRVWCAAEGENGQPVLAAYAAAPSAGVVKGDIVDLAAAAPALAQALHDAETQLGGAKISAAAVALSGAALDSLHAPAAVELDEAVTAEDLEKAKAIARATPLPEGHEPICTIPGLSRVDGAPTSRPVDMPGSRLETDMLIVHHARSNMLRFKAALDAEELRLEEIYFSGLCAATAALAPEEKAAGAVLIDLGAGTTDFVAYASRTIADAGALAVGGNHFTSDLARAFRLGRADAEALKHRGSVSIAASDRTRRIPLASSGPAAGRSARASVVNAVLRVRAEELFCILRDRFERKGLLSAIRASGVVLAGGGAHLAGLPDLVSRLFGCPCRVGGPDNLHGVPQDLRVPECAAGAGALLLAHRDREADVARRGGVLKAIGRWFSVR